MDLGILEFPQPSLLFEKPSVMTILTLAVLDILGVHLLLVGFSWLVASIRCHPRPRRNGRAFNIIPISLEVPE